MRKAIENAPIIGIVVGFLIGFLGGPSPDLWSSFILGFGGAIAGLAVGWLIRKFWYRRP
jgi:hypothetical protein